MSRNKTNDRRFRNFVRKIIRVIGIFLHILPKTTTQIDDSKLVTARKYKCSECNATNCKLWRQRGDSILLCFKCIAQENRLPTAVSDTLDDAGSVVMNGRRTSFIDQSYGGRFNYEPGAPAPKGWYNIFNLDPESVRACEWWQNLPSMPGK
jgi:Zn ribbon nucleic-acid-binding protein